MATRGRTWTCGGCATPMRGRGGGAGVRGLRRAIGPVAATTAVAGVATTEAVAAGTRAVAAEVGAVAGAVVAVEVEFAGTASRPSARSALGRSGFGARTLPNGVRPGRDRLTATREGVCPESVL